MVLGDVAAQVYEYCDRIRSRRQIVKMLGDADVSGWEATQVQALLDEFVAHKLMVREGEKYLSLAVMTYASAFETKGRRQEPRSVETRQAAAVA